MRRRIFALCEACRRQRTLNQVPGPCCVGAVGGNPGIDAKLAPCRAFLQSKLSSTLQSKLSSALIARVCPSVWQ